MALNIHLTVYEFYLLIVLLLIFTLHCTVSTWRLDLLNSSDNLIHCDILLKEFWSLQHPTSKAMLFEICWFEQNSLLFGAHNKIWYMTLLLYNRFVWNSANSVSSRTSTEVAKIYARAPNKVSCCANRCVCCATDSQYQQCVTVLVIKHWRSGFKDCHQRQYNIQENRDWRSHCERDQEWSQASGQYICTSIN